MSVVGTAQERPDSPILLNAEVGERSYARTFIVQTNALADGPKIVTAAPGIPRLFSPYVFGNERDQYCLARSFTAERLHHSSFYWIVRVEYRTPTKQEIQGQNDNPLLELPDVETHMEKFQEVVYAVFDDHNELTPCRASNGQVFDPPPTKDASRLVLTITRNEAITVLHPSVDIIYTDAVNSDVFWGCLPGVWKCQGVSTQRQTRQLSNGGRLAYLRCTYKFEARPTWITRLLDAGSYFKDSATGKRLQFLSDDGHPITGPLDGNGDKLPEGKNPVYRLFNFYLRRPFGPLRLPQSFAQVA